MILDEETSQTSTVVDTFSPGDVHNVTIYEVHNLPFGEHSIKIVNEPNMTGISGRVGESSLLLSSPSSLSLQPLTLPTVCSDISGIFAVDALVVIVVKYT